MYISRKNIPIKGYNWLCQYVQIIGYYLDNQEPIIGCNNESTHFLTKVEEFHERHRKDFYLKYVYPENYKEHFLDTLKKFATCKSEYTSK